MNDIIWTPGMTLDYVEKLVILKAYAFFKHNKTTTANALGISTKTLDTKLEAYDKESGLQRARDEYEQKRRNEFLAKSRGILPDNINGVKPHDYSQIQKIPVSSSASGVRMESIANSSEKPAMPMPERKEVQKVLPVDTSKGNPKRKG